MKYLVSILLVSGLTLSLNAHNLWSYGENGDVLKADIIYGHDFPKPESIVQERVQIFAPMKVVGDGYEEVLTQKGENYHYEGKTLKKGTYLLLSEYKPTSWIKKKDGKWEMGKTRKDMPNEVELCEVAVMSSKMIIVVDNDDVSFATKPVGKGLEFTPLSKASNIKNGEMVQFKVTQNGKPVKKARVYGTYSGYASGDMSMAFYAMIDLDGVFEFRPLKKGVWYLITNVKSDSGDKDCESTLTNASIVFEVK